MFMRVSWASAARESTANDIFIFPKQWKCMTFATASQLGLDFASLIFQYVNI